MNLILNIIEVTKQTKSVNLWGLIKLVVSRANDNIPEQSSVHRDLQPLFKLYLTQGPTP